MDKCQEMPWRHDLDALWRTRNADMSELLDETHDFLCDDKQAATRAQFQIKAPLPVGLTRAPDSLGLYVYATGRPSASTLPPGASGRPPASSTPPAEVVFAGTGTPMTIEMRAS
jgi:hypothetical protein